MDVPVDDSLHALLARAEDARTRGDFRAGLEAASRAWALPAPPAEHGRAGWLLAFCRLRCGDLHGVVALAGELLPLLRRQGAGDDLIEYLRILTLAACDLGRFELALPHAYEVQALAHERGGPDHKAMALNAFAACFERMGDPWQAERLMLDALQLAREVDRPYELFVSLNNLCATLIGAYHMLRGGPDPEQALAPLRRALPHARELLALLPRLTDPFMHVFARGNLGEVLILLGEDDEGEGLLQAAMASARAAGFRPQLDRMRCTEAERCLQRGDAAAALADMQALLAEGAMSPTTALRAHHVAYRAARTGGDAATALHHLERADELLRQRTVEQLRAQSEQFITRFEAEQARREADRQRERVRALEVDTRRDQLTGLGNRRELAHRLPAMLAEAARVDSPLALVTLDLDHFKQVNDRFGHPAGDAALVAVAQMLHENMRAGDLVARTGGEEFLVVLPDTAPERAHEVCERLRLRIQRHDWHAIAPGLAVTASIGIAAAPSYDQTALTARSDAALYRAKAEGRNRVVIG